MASMQGRQIDLQDNEVLEQVCIFIKSLCREVLCSWSHVVHPHYALIPFWFVVCALCFGTVNFFLFAIVECGTFLHFQNAFCTSGMLFCTQHNSHEYYGAGAFLHWQCKDRRTDGLTPPYESIVRTFTNGAFAYCAHTLASPFSPPGNRTPMLFLEYAIVPKEIMGEGMCRVSRERFCTKE